MTGTQRAGLRLLVTGCAGFIASKVAEQALDAGHEVVGIDDLNDYYDVRLKQWRLDVFARYAFHLDSQSQGASVG